jgi:putative nucleotidyltransferase-like protein
MSTEINRTLLSQIISERTQALALDSFTPGDWELLMKEAQAEGVGPLLYWALTRSGKIPRLPQVIANCLRAMYFSTRMNNEQIVQELVTLSRRFDEAGISVVVLKGSCFALTIYPDLGLRPMVDIDLLIPVAEWANAVRIVVGSGYVQAAPEAFPGLHALLDHADAVCLKKRTIPFTTLELHKTLVAGRPSNRSVPADWFWSQTEPISRMSSRRIIPSPLMLTPTAQLLYVCGHGMVQHGGIDPSLRWLYDLDRLIRIYAERLDWDLVFVQAGKFGWSSAVLAALSEVIRLFDTPIPARLLENLS